MALLKGANRPLLTRLIIQEVQIETGNSYRPTIDIDFGSSKVIQCAGDLAQLEEDDVVRSIGCGSTERLSSFFSNDQDISPKKAKVDDFEEEAIESDEVVGDEQEAEASEEVEKSEAGEKGEGLEARGENAEALEDYEAFDEDEEYEYDEDDLADDEEGKVDKLDGGGVVTAFSGHDVKVEESAFGKKIRKRKKKMETRLLKEILNDVKMSSKRY